jgi:tetratricopeptide (TPR) repeat protein
VSTKQPRLYVRYLILAIVIAIVVVVVSVILYPEWTASLRAMLGLLAAVVTIVLASVAYVRQIIEPPPADTPAAPPPSIQTSDQSGGANVVGNVTDSEIVGRDKIIAARDVIGRDKITQIIQAQPPAVQALHSLPPPPADFTGRVAEVDQLIQRLGEGTGAAISGLSGMGGIGKTALAIYVAQRLTDRYPDAQILLDLQGTSDPPLAPADAMAQVIRAFQPQADLRQVSESELPALYRSVLSDKPALLLLDNARDAAQVRPLLPPPPCAVIVTSRRHFVMPGLQPLRLDVLKPDDARDLLLSICLRLDANAGRLAELCGYLPLALRIAASDLAARVDLSPADYLAQLEAHRLARLASEDDPDQNVERVFDLSYGQLAPEMQARFRALAVFPAPFDSLAAASVWALEPEPTRESLSELVRSSLVEYDAPPSPASSRGGLGGGGEGRYRLHDLLRDFADARLTPDERYTAQLRHAQYYLQVATAAKELYKKGADNVLSGLALFDAEFPHIRAGQAWSASLASTDEDAARLCYQYPDAAVHIIDLRLHSRQWIAWLESALAAGRQLGDRQGEGAHLGNLGLAYADLGEVQKAIEYYEQSLAIDRTIGDRQGEGSRLGNLGNAYSDLDDLPTALAYAESALKIFEAIESPNADRARKQLDDLRQKSRPS